MSTDDRRRAVGKIVNVAADRFVVEMHAGTDSFTVVGFDDVHYVARIGSYLMVPTQGDYVVVEVVGLREKDAPGGGDMEKAASAKFLDVAPIGTLPASSGEKFRFGVSVFPSLYADALYALDGELDRIFDTDRDTVPGIGREGGACVPPTATRYRNLAIGRSVVFEDYDVKVRIDDFFGGHAAVLGNTGSGKSCTIASVLQALFEKPDEHHARGATFVVLDVNGEYHTAFAKMPKVAGLDVKRIVLDGTGEPGTFQLPHWFLDLSEWELLLQASERTQVPILRMALGLATMFGSGTADELKTFRNHVLATCITQILGDDTPPGAKETRIRGILTRFSTPQINAVKLSAWIKVSFANMKDPASAAEYLKGGDGASGFINPDLKLPDYAGLPFDFDALDDALDLALLYQEAHGNRQIRDYCAPMVTRFKNLARRSDYAFLRHKADTEVEAPAFLASLLGLSPASGGHTKSHQIVILDMNAVEDEVVELVSAVVARMIFRLLRRAEPRNRFPVHLLLEEAHRYVSSSPSRYAMDASRIFERVAKEGRKYGLFLLVASQRPSELSKTVLSQCSNFVVHRIQNPDDLSQIRQMTPFISESVLRRLPSLPKQHALVFGNSVNLPTTFKVRRADPLPASDDAHVVELWFHEAERISPLRLTVIADGTGEDRFTAPTRALPPAGAEQEEA